ncbi:16151_t:CDS:2 [Racocetra persica]|uniref:16151_t:CDS:1 n=1 Tax=Racocetra persica TaxID=160502 RepID=A0ACA9Q0D5_9GLOM|nr:16151_t:CDS:2 [Racocetra persica]
MTSKYRQGNFDEETKKYAISVREKIKKEMRLRVEARTLFVKSSYTVERGKNNIESAVINGKESILQAKVGKNEPSLKEQLSLNNDEKAKEVKELVENQTESNQKDTVINLEENEQGGLTKKENSQEQTSLQTQQLQEPK